MSAQAAKFCWRRRRSPCSPSIRSSRNISTARRQAAFLRPGWRLRSCRAKTMCSPPPTAPRISRSWPACATMSCSTPAPSCAPTRRRSSLPGSRPACASIPSAPHRRATRSMTPAARSPASALPGRSSTPRCCRCSAACTSTRFASRIPMRWRRRWTPSRHASASFSPDCAG